jgi:hypothetical protein
MSNVTRVLLDRNPFVGRGPERGDGRNWFFETGDVELPAGAHAIVARTWWVVRFSRAPFAQHSVRSRFLPAAEAPTSFGCDTVTVRPDLGGLEWARGKTVHPKGLIVTDVRQDKPRDTGTIRLPPGVRGMFVDGDRTIELTADENRV